MWEPQRDALDGYDVDTPTLYDLPGRTIDEWADALVRSSDDSLVLVGASMGGFLALAVAARAPERVAGIVLVGSRIDAESPERRAARADQLAAIEANGAEGLWRAMRPRLFPAEAEAEILARARSIALAQTPDGLTRAVEAIRDRPDRSDLVASLACPLLVVVGDSDSIVSVEEARTFAETARDGKLVVIEGAGHLPSLEQPEAFNPVLSEFLSRWPRAAATGAEGHARGELPFVVDAEWLAAHLGDEDVLVADVRGPNAFARHGHIPGAIPLVLGSPPPMSDEEAIRDFATEVGRRLGRHGVTGSERLVLYDLGDCVGACASAQAAELAGHPAVAVLAGGIAAWPGELETGAIELDKGRPSFEPNLEVLPTRDELHARLDDPELLILDVRSDEEYSGRGGAPCDPRQGRIPGARHLEHVRLFRAPGQPVPPEMVVALTGLPPQSEIVTYCHTGARSALAAMALRSAGYRARNYVGSWHEWSRHAELPMERG
jgi:3-mercaptopyruvate sulfurtransferase SseA/pimeloyl-ACP methyl ester carboxylesterase